MMELEEAQENAAKRHTIRARLGKSTARRCSSVVAGDGGGVHA
jgi:hypothetical protein